MPNEIWERLGSRRIEQGPDGDRATFLYFIRGTNNELSVVTTLLEHAPVVWESLLRSSYVAEQVGDKLWTVDLLYEDEASQQKRSQKKPPETGSSSYSFDTSGGTVKVTQSLETLRKYPPETAPDHGGAIGVGLDGQPEGVEIPVPAMKFSETHYLPASMVTLAYINTLYRLTGKVNNAVFRQFAPGELRFRGASGRRRGLGDYEVEYSFDASENVTGLSVGDFTDIEKEGWSYLWTYYGREIDQDAHAVLTKPKAIYIERVHQYADFSALGIGT